MKFSDFNFDERVDQGLDAMGFEKPTPVQEQAIPFIMDKRDLIACAQTGTGKTAAFLLPSLNDISKSQGEGINTLVIAPTRELAVQIDQQVEGLGYFVGARSMAIYGGGDGSAFETEKQALTGGADIIIATPGKLISHLNLGYVDFSKVKHLVLDEADRMLDMGFSEDIEKIISYLPKERQNLMFSATMPPKIRKLAGDILVDPEQINIAISKPPSGVMQAAFMVYDGHKLSLVTHLLKAKPIETIIVFCSTKKAVQNVFRLLKKEGFNVAAISSDLEQSDREKVLLDFKNRALNILVATDVMSRGIDIDGIGLVINYDVPNDAEDYVHRIGRTARADKTGVAFTFVGEKEMEKFYYIEKLLEIEIPKAKVPESIGDGPVYDPSKYDRPRRGKSSFSRKNGKGKR